ncbi:hypothetical protein ACFFV7_52975 [Nonomuraea spiralis]|uniref:Uncharacterized protein n=1 Tax=Nonomuraea spiralis TaxID=46182 RepID=A0ABV5IZK6_9ACTN|nr:hypothetical protein [Nonomuraea spiralis]
MYGNEVALRILVDHLAHVEQREDHWSAALQDWKTHGAFMSTGVTGAFACLIPGHYACGVASIYAEFARTQGWLQADRTLTLQEYRALTATISTWTALNRTLTEVTTAFGPPSILFGGNNPLYGKTLSYLTGVPEEPMISFHLWNGPALEAEQQWPPAHAEPVLLAVRIGEGNFGQSFTFTPEGRLRRPV